MADQDIINDDSQREICGSVRASGAVQREVKELYTCCRCGITNIEHRAWGPVCPETGKRVCDICCLNCSYHVRWSGIWRCAYVSEAKKREEVKRRIRNSFEEENRRVSEAYYRKKREEARKRAIKAAKAKKSK